MIEDFDLDNNEIGLSDGLSYEAETLDILEGISAETLTESDFIAV